ncbi:DUF3168 domain-containing protein [Viridibacillus arvi]|uniref:DUF3168 domain-containing protein n=1 Tax=Viridibacillus arvi TaxID=263475 RepID=UPI00381190C1
MAYELPFLDLQIAIIKKLKSDTALMAKAKGVFDAVQKNQAFPYITVGEPFSMPFDTKTSNGEELNLTIHVWSQFNGKREAYELLGMCQRQLMQRGYEVSGFKIESIVRKGTQVFDDVDASTKHGVLNMKYTITNK